MIPSLLILIATLVIVLITGLLGAIGSLMPTAIQTGFTNLFSGLGYFQGIFPVDQILLAFKCLLGIIVIKYMLKWALNGLNAIPGVQLHLPRFFKHK